MKQETLFRGAMLTQQQIDKVLRVAKTKSGSTKFTEGLRYIITNFKEH